MGYLDNHGLLRFLNNLKTFISNNYAPKSHRHTTTELDEPNYTNSITAKTTRTLINDVRANRLMFLPANNIIIEKTTDGGTTWVSANIDDTVKRSLFSQTRPSISIPLLNGVKSTLCGLRVTITAMNYNVPNGTPETEKYNYWSKDYVKSQERYCQLKDCYFWVNAISDTINVKVERSTGASPNSWATIFNQPKWGMTGWSGSNYVSFNQSTFGGSVGQTSNYWNYRFTFFTAPPNGKTELTTGTYAATPQTISEIRGYGDSYWTSANSMMSIDHIYSWDGSKNVTFPAKVKATDGFDGVIPDTKEGLISTINKLEIGSATPQDNDYYISQYAGGGTTTTTYHRRTMFALWSYIKGKADTVFSAIGHKHTKNDITDLDAADTNITFNEYLSPNRFAGVHSDGVEIEYSRDGGKTWKDYGASDIDKRRLFTTRACEFRIGGPSEVGAYTPNGKLRITLKTGAANVYTVLERLHIYASTAFSQDCKITIKAAYESEPNNYVKTIVEDMLFDGWPDWKMINLFEHGGAITTYGNDPSWQYGRIRFEFSAGELSDPSQTEYGFQVISIFGYGGVGWETPSNMALNGHAYAYDADMAVEFPNTVYADGGFLGTGTYLTELNVDNVEHGVLPIEHGGTGATTLEELRENLGTGVSNDEVNYLMNGGQKNILEFVGNSVLTINGITFTKLANGEIVANGTATTSAFYKSGGFTLPEGDYVLNGGAADGASDKWALQRYINGSVVDNIYDDEAEIEFTSDTSKTYEIYIVIRGGQTVNNLTFKPMIRKAIISDTTFVPYAPTNKELYDNKASQNEMNFIMSGNQKNQFGVAIANSIAWNSSVTYNKVSECEYTLTATATSSSDLALFNTDNSAYKNLYGLESTNYILTTNNPNILITVDTSTNGTSWGTSTYPNWQSAPISFDLSKAKGVRIRCRLKKGTSLNNTNVKFMLRPSYIKDDTFIPYIPTNSEIATQLNALSNILNPRVCTVEEYQAKSNEEKQGIWYIRK